MRTTPEQRKLMVQAVKRGNDINIVAKILNRSVRTVYRWIKRAFHPGKELYKDKPRKAKKSRITLKVELAILAMRNLFEWGTARIQQGLINLPSYMKEVLHGCAQNVKLSRAAINNVLKKHSLNGYKHKSEGWKFFRAKKPDELWQLDIKGPFRLRGKRYYFVICIDDHTRYLLLAEQLNHCPNIQEICNLLKPLIRKRKPEKILTDNNPFKADWDIWCRENEIEPLHAHPYYPQDKGKVERAIRNVAEEFIYLLKKFPQWLNGKLRKYQHWFNHRRFHRGINDYPANLYL